MRPGSEPSSKEPPSSGGEHGAIARWTRGPLPGVTVGPGDDCAWLGGLAVSVDTVVEGVHFRFDWSSPEDVGWKALAAALSDLAASRARPRGALVSLSVGREELAPGALGDRLMAGVHACADAFACPVIGGDVVASDGPVQLAVTVLGEGLGAPLLRSGARAGDVLCRSGATGWAGLAVRHLLAGQDAPARALAAHRRPRPRLDLLDDLARATAAIDVSDGLLADAAWIARASGVTLRLDRDACVADGPDDACALGGGEDYELLATFPSPPPGWQPIGIVEAGPPYLLWTDGSPVAEAGRGWDHGAGDVP